VLLGFVGGFCREIMNLKGKKKKKKKIKIKIKKNLKKNFKKKHSPQGGRF
jgi:hypothetical protein